MFGHLRNWRGFRVALLYEWILAECVLLKDFFGERFKYVNFFLVSYFFAHGSCGKISAARRNKTIERGKEQSHVAQLYDFRVCAFLETGRDKKLNVRTRASFIFDGVFLNHLGFRLSFFASLHSSCYTSHSLICWSRGFRRCRLSVQRISCSYL